MLVVLTAMVAAGPAYHLDHWRNTYKLIFFAEQNIYMFYGMMGLLLCTGPISYWVAHELIFSVDWRETEEPPLPKGKIAVYLRQLQKQSVTPQDVREDNAKPSGRRGLKMPPRGRHAEGAWEMKNQA